MTHLPADQRKIILALKKHRSIRINIFADYKCTYRRDLYSVGKGATIQIGDESFNMKSIDSLFEKGILNSRCVDFERGDYICGLSKHGLGVCDWINRQSFNKFMPLDYDKKAKARP